VLAFARREAEADTLQQILTDEQQRFQADQLISLFSYKKIQSALLAFKEWLPGKKLPNMPAALAIAQLLMGRASEQAAVAEKFQRQLQQLLLLPFNAANAGLLEDRVARAIDYFVPTAGNELLLPLQQQLATLQTTSKLRKQAVELNNIIASLQCALQKMVSASYRDIVFCKTPAKYEKYTVAHPDTQSPHSIEKKPVVKGSSHAATLAMFKEGNSIEAIAASRQLAATTISGHLASFVLTGEIAVTELLTNEQLALILPVVMRVGGNKTAPIKDELGGDVSHAEIRIVLNYWQRQQSQLVNS
jgi:hypothetical protein